MAKDAINTTVLAVEGMTCGSCSRRVEAALSAVPGVSKVEVDLPSGKATITAAATPVDDLLSAVRNAGYSAQPEA